MSDRAAPPSRDAARRTPGRRKPARKSLTERLQSTLANAAEEHRANAEPDHAWPPRAAAPGRQPRRARLRLTRIDPWSVMKTAFLLSVAFGIVTVRGDLHGVVGARCGRRLGVVNPLVPASSRATRHLELRRGPTTSAPPACSASRCWSR